MERKIHYMRLKGLWKVRAEDLRVTGGGGPGGSEAAPFVQAVMREQQERADDDDGEGGHGSGGGRAGGGSGGGSSIGGDSNPGAASFRSGGSNRSGGGGGGNAAGGGNAGVELLGVGTFGTVYAAALHGTKVAVKWCRPLPAATGGGVPAVAPHTARSSFHQEMDAMSRLRHPNILLVLGAVDAAQPMIIMEYCERGSLRRNLDAVAASPTLLRSVAVWRLHLRLATEAAAGLNHAHVCSYSHGDIKSPNVLVTRAFVAKPVQDFADTLVD